MFSAKDIRQQIRELEKKIKELQADARHRQKLKKIVPLKTVKLVELYTAQINWLAGGADLAYSIEGWQEPEEEEEEELEEKD